MKKVFLGILILLFSTSLILAYHMNVPASAFTGRDSAELYMRSTYGEYVYTASVSSGYLTAPAILPEGASIKNVRLHYIDNTDSGYIQVHLVRLNHFTGTSSNVFSVTTQGLASSSSVRWVVDSSPSPAKQAYRQVQNGQVTWNVYAHFSSSSSDLRIYSVQIEFTY